MGWFYKRQFNLVLSLMDDDVVTDVYVVKSLGPFPMQSARFGGHFVFISLCCLFDGNSWDFLRIIRW